MTDPMVMAQKLLQKHFPKFGTFRRSCSYKEMDNSTYNAVTGAVTEVVVSTQDFVQIIFDYPSVRQGRYVLFGHELIVHSINRVAIIPTLDLNVIPEAKDQIVDPDGVVWVVLAIADDPGPVHYELLIRPRGTT